MGCVIDLERIPEMNTYQIVVLPGEGIGPEIVDGALQVLETLQKKLGHFHLDYKFYEAGAACYQNTGEPISAQALKAIETADAQALIFSCCNAFLVSLATFALSHCFSRCLNSQ